MAGQKCSNASSASAYNKNSYENTHIFDKTRLCKFYAKGKCKRGKACSFAHGEGEVQVQPDFFRTQLCADYDRSGMCKSGSDCRFAHSSCEIRKAKTQHKTSSGQGSRTAADSQASSEVRELGMTKQEASPSRSQLRGLKLIDCQEVQDTSRARDASVPSAFGAEASWFCKMPHVWQEEAEEDDSWLDATTDFGRESTEEGTELPPRFGRKFAKDDTWDDLTSTSAAGSDAAGSELLSEASEACTTEEETACELVVKGTFISLRPAQAGSHRRTQSAPAVRRAGLA